MRKIPNLTFEEWQAKIPTLTQAECMELHRFAPIGHILFNNDRLCDDFKRQFKKVGGITTAVSKEVGWEN